MRDLGKDMGITQKTLTDAFKYIYKILELLWKLLCIVCMVPQSVDITGIEAYTAGVYRYTKYTF